jgi:hypothetical protein
MYKQKYIKYKLKYFNLLNLYKNQLGGEFRTKIDNCEKISNFMEELNVIIWNDKNNNTDYLKQINELYESNILLFENELNQLVIANINYLLDIKLNQITNNTIRELISDIYTKKLYNENPIGLKFTSDNFLHPDCLRDINVWYKPYLLEDFWKCDINEFMDEIDKFDESELLHSFKLFWTNIINISSLLCKIKTCNYYFIKFEDDSKIPTIETYNQMLQNNEIFKMTDLNITNLTSYVNIKNFNPNVKLIFTYIRNIDNTILFDFTKLLIKCFNCNYDYLLEFYLKFLCTMKDLEIHNPNFISDLTGIIQNICNDNDNVLQNKDVLLYLSLNLPKDSTYARNEYTNFICSSINSLFLIDTIPLSMCQIVGHDYYFHGAKNKKIQCSEVNKKEFKKFLLCLETINKEKVINTFDTIIKIVKNVYFLNDNLNNFKNNFIQNYINKYRDYNMLTMLDLLHFIFHEKRAVECINSISITNEINKYLTYELNFNAEKKEEIEYIFKMITFLIYCKSINIVKLNNNFQEIINNIFKYFIIMEYVKENNLSKSEQDFAKAYATQLIKMNKCLLGENKIVEKINLDIFGNS